MTCLLTTASLILLAVACAGGDAESSGGPPKEDVRAADLESDLTRDASPDSLPDSLSDVAAEIPDSRVDLLNDAGPETFPDTEITVPPPDIGVDLSSDTAPDTPTAPEVPLEGFGAITGACGVLSPAELTDESPYFFVNHLDLGDDPYDEEDLEFLTAGGQEIWSDGNAGGSSIYSEIFAYEMLHRCELAILLKTELEIEYRIPDSKITDLLVEIDGSKVGVSVTRAVGWPRDAVWTTDQAVTLLEKKLQGIQDSSSAVASTDAWTKQILHIIAYADQHAEAIQTALDETITSDLAEDTIVIVTVSDGDDGFLY